MTDLIKINHDTENPTVSGRELHTFLEVDTEYAKWLLRMTEYGFTEGVDYSTFLTNRVDGLPGKPRTDHNLTIPMAKEICMIQRSEKGKQARQYFIQLEAAWNTPEMVMARALKYSQAQFDKLLGENLTLQAANSTLTVEKQIMQPKAEYFDELVDRNLMTGLRETAKQLSVAPKIFVQFLLDKKYLYRDKRGKLMPYAQHTDSGLFTLKECVSDKTEWAGTQTLVTPKGRETFRLLFPGALSCPHTAS